MVILIFPQINNAMEATQKLTKYDIPVAISELKYFSPKLLVCSPLFFTCPHFLCLRKKREEYENGGENVISGKRQVGAED